MSTSANDRRLPHADGTTGASSFFVSSFLSTNGGVNVTFGLLATTSGFLVEMVLLVLVVMVGVGALSKAAAYPPFGISAVDDVVLLVAVVVDAASDDLADWLTFS